MAMGGPAGHSRAPHPVNAKPKLTIQAAVDTVAAGNGKYVLVSAGEYGPVNLKKQALSIGVYGD